MKDVIITVICVAVLGAAGFIVTYKVIEKQQAVAIKSIEVPSATKKVQYAGALKDIAVQQAEDTATRYKYSLIVGAVGILIGIGAGVLICDMLEEKPKKQPTTPTTA